MIRLTKTKRPRKLAIPAHILGELEHHFDTYAGTGSEGLFIPAAKDPTKNLSTSTMHKVFDFAAEKCGHGDMHFHDLRHFGLTMTAATGATLREIMARGGHSTVDAAMRYQNLVSDSDSRIAAALSQLAMQG